MSKNTTDLTAPAPAGCESWCQLRDDIAHEDCNGKIRRVPESLRGSTIEVFPISWVSFSGQPRDKQVNVEDDHGRTCLALTATEARSLARALVSCADVLDKAEAAR